MISRIAPLFFAGVIAVAVVGFFVGIMAGVPQPDGMVGSGTHPEFQPADSSQTLTSVATVKQIPAVAYADIAHTSMGPTKGWQATPQALPQPEYDLYTKIEPSAAEKEASSQVRASRRAFNGAPPIIPHPVENTTDAACYACHSNGVKMAGLKASVMSHEFLGNCVQCHAPMAPAPFQEVDASVQTSFVGLPAPKAGQRAYQGAPPTIPHSRWMRENCSACHGGPNGWAGMESTHPWRTNCTQCHAPSASLDQMPESGVVSMLPPLDVVDNKGE
ncbi:cytochrome c-type protein NapB [Neorhodopirellula lusitana]|uniref:Cytochrome c-type protein NapB n=1 Tax=Neorhodopirellula lusitana TaxID=445327 RepID=A0ABY1Q5Y8_9BACT|nr:diheme cytochrome c precursor [Neorhodopirellula lusitana]SMP59769.1 cytochrome c-type protein NapB [Neorhodopirellula lusitana]